MVGVALAEQRRFGWWQDAGGPKAYKDHEHVGGCDPEPDSSSTQARDPKRLLPEMRQTPVGVRAYPAGATLARRRLIPPKRPAGPAAMARPHAPQEYPATSRGRPGPLVEVRAGQTAPCERSSSLLTMQRGRGDLVCGWRPGACLPLSSTRRGTRVPRPRLRPALLTKPLELGEQHAAELSEVDRRIFECDEDPLAFGDGEREHLHLSPVGVFELVR